MDITWSYILKPVRARRIIGSTNEGLRTSQTSSLIVFTIKLNCFRVLVVFSLSQSRLNALNLEPTGLTATTCLLELTSLTPDEGLNTIVGVGVVDRCPLSEVGQGGTALGTTEQDSVGSSGCPQGELIKSDALSTGGDNTLACILSERKGAHTQLGAFEHANIIGDLSNDDGGLVGLLSHVFGDTVEADGGSIDARHVKTLGNGRAECGVSTAGKEFVQFDKKTVVGILGLDNLIRGLVTATTASGFKINSHGDKFI